MAIHMEKNKIRSLLYAKSISGELTNMKSKNRKILESNIAIYFYDVSSRTRFLKTKHAKHNSLLAAYLKIKTCSSKYIKRGWGETSQNWARYLQQNRQNISVQNIYRNLKINEINTNQPKEK